MVIKGLKAIYDANRLIRDCYVSELRFYLEGHKMSLDINIVNNPDEKTFQALLTFSAVSEFTFYFNKDYSMFIEDYKLLFDIEHNEYYFSLDPDNAAINILDTDKDIVRSKDFQLLIDM